MATAKKLKSGKWRTLVYSHTENGKRKYESFTADTKKESEYLAAEFAISKETKGQECLSMTFGKALDDYINKRSSVLSPATIREYKRLRQKNLKLIIDISLKDITQQLIQEQVNEEAITHSAKSVRNMHGLISAILKVYRPDFALHTALPKKVRPNIYIPTDVEIKHLLKTVENTSLEIPVLLAAFGPMRRGEICALDSDDIVGNIIHVRRSMVLNEHKDWIVKSPKSYAGDRYIEFPDFVIDKLKDIEGSITSLTPDNVTKKFVNTLKRIGLKHFRFHDLRHYNASISHALGIPDQYIMTRGGWSSDRVLKNVYRHTMSDRMQQMTNKANEHFKTLLE
jgi:integrase